VRAEDSLTNLRRRRPQPTHGLQEVAWLMREWEDMEKVVEEQEAEVRE
jgi:hypothetical protein